MHKCFHCHRPLVKEIKSDRPVFAKLCYNCGRVQAPRRSEKPQKPRSK